MERAVQSISKMDIVTSDGTVIRGGVEFRNTGAIVEGEVGKEIFKNGAMVVKLGAGAKHREFLTSLGFKSGENNYWVLTHDELHNQLEHQFDTQSKTGWFKQVTDAVTWTWVNPDLDSRIKFGKVSAYQSKSDSVSYGDEEFSRETPELYELFAKEMRVAGMKKAGVEGTFGYKITDATTMSLGLGAESAKFDFLVPEDAKTSLTGKIAFQHKLDEKTQLVASLATSSTENRLSLGYSQRFVNGLNASVQGYVSDPVGGMGKTTSGVMFNISGKFNLDGMGNIKSANTRRSEPNMKHSAVAESRPPVATERPGYMKPMANGNYSVSASDYLAANGSMDAVPAPVANEAASEKSNGSAGRSKNNSAAFAIPVMAPKNVLDATFQAGREAFFPKTVTVQKDATVVVRRMVAIDKSDLPPGARIDTLTGNIVIPTGMQLGNIETAINATNGQMLPLAAFSITGSVIIINTKVLEPILSRGTNSLEVTTENAIMTIIAEKGSVIIKSIKVEPRYKVPEAPKATMNDDDNLIVLPEGTTADQFEIAPTAAGPYVTYAA